AVPAQGAPHLRRRRPPGVRDRRDGCRRGAQRQRVGRRARLDHTRSACHPQPHRPATGGGGMKNSDLLIAANTLWVVVAAVLVMFMQAGFAFIEAGLTRMKNAAHIAGKNVLIFVFGAAFTVIYSITSHWVWGGGWLFGLGMQDFAGSTVVHYQGALAALAGAILLGPRIGKFDGTTRRGNAIPGHNIPYAVLGTLVLWFGWFGFNPGSTLSVVTGHRIGFFAYVALTTNLAAAA